MKSIEEVFDIKDFKSEMKIKRGDKCFRKAAKEVGISHMAYFKIEQRKTVPDLESAIRICDWLGTSLEYFKL